MNGDDAGGDVSGGDVEEGVECESCHEMLFALVLRRVACGVLDADVYFAIGG